MDSTSPAVHAPDPADLARQATTSASSSLRLTELPAGGPPCPLNRRTAQMLPLSAGAIPEITLWADVETPVTIEVELRGTSGPWHHTPDTVLSRTSASLAAGKMQPLKLSFPGEMPRRWIRVHHASRNAGRRAPYLAASSHRHLEADPPRRGKNGKCGWRALRSLHAPAPARRAQPRPANIPGPHLLRAAKPAEWLAAPHLHVPNAWVADPADSSAGDHSHLDITRDILGNLLWLLTEISITRWRLSCGAPRTRVVFCVKRYEILDDQGHAGGRRRSPPQHRASPPG